MTESMDLDDPPKANGSGGSNAMSMLMSNAKGKGKADINGTTNGSMSEAELKALNDREGMPWCVTSGAGSQLRLM